MFVLHCSSAARQQCPSTATRNAFGGRSRTRRISLRRSATSLCGGTICLRMRRPERRYSPTHPRILVGQETTGAEREQRARTQLEVLCRGSHTPSLWGWGLVRCFPLSRACGRWIGRSVSRPVGRRRGQGGIRGTDLTNASARGTRQPRLRNYQERMMQRYYKKNTGHLVETHIALL